MEVWGIVGTELNKPPVGGAAVSSVVPPNVVFVAEAADVKPKSPPGVVVDDVLPKSPPVVVVPGVVVLVENKDDEVLGWEGVDGAPVFEANSPPVVPLDEPDVLVGFELAKKEELPEPDVGLEPNNPPPILLELLEPNNPPPWVWDPAVVGVVETGVVALVVEEGTVAVA
jgi:hypothetical protein